MLSAEKTSSESVSFTERRTSLASLEQQGFLLKRSEYLHKWNKRWFALDAIYTRSLYYYEDEDKSRLIGSYAITAETTLEIAPSSTDEFTLHSDGKVLVVKSESNMEKMEWITSIKYVIDMEQSQANSKGTIAGKSKARPFVARALNAACVVPKAFNMGSWGKPNTIESAVAAVKQNLGMDSTGNNIDEKRMINMYSLCRRLGTERSGTKYTPFGHYMVLEGLIHKVTIRLKLLDYFRRHPSIENISLGPGDPVIIIGLNGSGESSIHSLLSTHPEFRVHYTWEQLDPVPSTDDESRDAQEQDRSSRYQKNKKIFTRAIVASGVGEDMNSLHEIDYDGAEECTIPCAMELPWSILEIPFNAFAARELMSLGAGSAYPLYRKYLQLLTWQSNRCVKDSLWLLHSPHHLPYIRDIHRTFPNSTYVWVHRNPADCISTICTMYDIILRMVMTRSTINRAALGRAVLEYAKESLERATRAIHQLQSEIRIIHICLPNGDNFANVDIDAMKVACRAISNSAGVTYSKSFDEELTRGLSEMRVSSIAVDDNIEKNLTLYGLSRNLIDPHFVEYVEEFVHPTAAPSTGASATIGSYLLVGCDHGAGHHHIRHGGGQAMTTAATYENSSGSNSRVMVIVLVTLIAFNVAIALFSSIMSVIPADHTSSILAIGNMLIAGAALFLLWSAKIGDQLLSAASKPRKSTSVSPVITFPSANSRTLGTISYHDTNVQTEGISPTASVGPAAAGDWKLRFSGKWKNIKCENTDEWFSKMNNFGFLVRVIAAKKMLTLQKEIRVEKISRQEVGGTDFVFYVERSFGGKDKHWKEHMPIGTARHSSTAKLSICDGNPLHVRMWADEKEKTLHMLFEPADESSDMRLIHSRRIVDDNILEMVWMGHNLTTDAKARMTTVFERVK